MRTENHRQYLERRVTQELHLAENGACPEAVRAHYTLLGLYLDRLYALEDERKEDGLAVAAMVRSR